jgi:hypothetical protein
LQGQPKNVRPAAVDTSSDEEDYLQQNLFFIEDD